MPTHQYFSLIVLRSCRQPGPAIPARKRLVRMEAVRFSR
jgi:hypothetical protein